MQSLLSKVVLGAAFTLFSAGAFAQQPRAPRLGCVDAGVRTRVEEIKQHYTAQGLVVARDAMLGMESQVPYPVMIQLQRGQLYQIVYVAHPEATRMWLDVYDGADKKLQEIMQSVGRGQPTYATFTFIPERTDTYMFVLRQKWKDKDMCGGFTILKVPAGKESMRLAPYTGT